VQPRLWQILTLVAASMLAFDGAALAVFGWLSGKALLVLLGCICFVSTGLVLWYWRWQRRRLEEIAALRRGVAEEARELGRFLGQK
jgi:hypothetical protein